MKNQGLKGSEYWIREIINSDLKRELDKILDDTINWMSPVKSSNYKERDINTILKSTKNEGIMEGFWKVRGRKPTWDAYGFGKEGRLYLVEAKANIEEYSSSMNLNNIDSEEKKRNLKIRLKELEKMDRRLGNKKFEKEKWINKNYQLGNRLAHWQELKAKGVDTRLIYLNIVNDKTYKATSRESWEKHYEEVSQELFGTYHPIFKEILYYFEV